MNIRKIAQQQPGQGEEEELIELELDVDMLALASEKGSSVYILDEQDLGMLGVNCHKLVDEMMPGEGQISSHHHDANQQPIAKDKVPVATKTIKEDNQHQLPSSKVTQVPSAPPTAPSKPVQQKTPATKKNYQGA